MADTIKESVVLVATVGEIEASAGEIVKIEPARLDRIKAADPGEHPAKFVTISVESGWSKNKRHWPAKVLDSIADQVRAKEPVGYKGHPLLKKDFDKGADFPDPQTLWLSAISTLTDKGKRLLVKGYNLTDGIRRELASGAVKTVSICGDATMRAVKGGYEVEEFELESLDWARPGGAGMSGGVIALTAEQTVTEESEIEEEVELVKPEDIANLTEGDLRKHNSSLADQIEQVGFDKGKKELEEKVGEQEAAIDAAKESVDVVAEVRKKLGLKDDESLTDAISKLVNDARAGLKSEFDSAVEKVLAKKIPDEKIRKLVQSLVGEMDSSVETEEDAAKDAEKRVNEILDTNEAVKELVGEMVDEEDEGKRERKRPVSPAHRYEEKRGNKDGEKKDTDNIAYETVEA